MSLLKCEGEHIERERTVFWIWGSEFPHFPLEIGVCSGLSCLRCFLGVFSI